jgi:hypothetical protein
MSSPAHRAALGFLRGGLIAVLSLAVAPALGAALASIFQSGWPVGIMQFLLPMCGFVLGGAIGGEAVGVGSRGATAFGCGGGAAGLVLLPTSSHLQGLTGFEDPLAVVSYAIVTSALAFGAMGLVGSLIVRRGKVSRIAAVFAVGGVVGAMLGVLPFLILHRGGAWWSEFQVFLTLACSIASVVAPFMVGGAAAAQNWS